MKTEVFHTLTKPAEDAAVEAAIRSLLKGDVAGLPTETVYGLAAVATDPKAVAKIFEAKERPHFDPLIVHLPDDEWLSRVTKIPETERALIGRLAARFWPGPLTFVLPRQEIISDIVTSGLETVAVRRSAHPIFRRIIEGVAKPLAAPSANRFGRISPTLASHVVTELSGRIPVVIDDGPTTHGIESTIIECVNGEIRILRPGPVTAEMLSDFAHVIVLSRHPELPTAPGQLDSHYAPATPVWIMKDPGAFQPEAAQRCGLLAWSTDVASEAYSEVEVLSRKQDLVEAASRFFSALRELDAAGLDLIVAEPVPETGVGLAIMDRLRRAAGVKRRQASE